MRYSLVYFARPEEGVLLKRLGAVMLFPGLAQGKVEEEVSSKEWDSCRAMGGWLVGFGKGDWGKHKGDGRNA